MEGIKEENLCVWAKAKEEGRGVGLKGKDGLKRSHVKRQVEICRVGV